MADLVAVTRRWHGDLDLIRFAGSNGVLFARSGIGLAGRGTAWRGPSDQVDRVLGGIQRDDEVACPGSGPVAFGALPFDPSAGGDVTIPSLIVARADDGDGWITAVADERIEPDPSALDVLDDGEADEPAHFEVKPVRPPADWCQAVAEATVRIARGDLEKVVLAREILVTGDHRFHAGAILRRLQNAYPECYLYGVEGYIGASPELLVSRHHDIVRAQPMAGTTARRGDPEADRLAAAALLASDTYRHEHQVTIDMVHDTLLRFCSYLDYEPEPAVVALANVAHLATRVEGRLSHPSASVLELVRELHPTPAVCGRPRAAALKLIEELEGFDRGRYAGAVGWVDADGNGEWAVAIRGTQLDGQTAHVYAGNGIVGDSDPATELAETRAKLQAMLGALIRP